MKISWQRWGAGWRTCWVSVGAWSLLMAAGLAQDGAGAGHAGGSAVTTPVPERFEFSRFAGLLENSPFAVATAAPAPTSTNPAEIRKRIRPIATDRAQ